MASARVVVWKEEAAAEEAEAEEEGGRRDEARRCIPREEGMAFAICECGRSGGGDGGGSV